MFFLVQRILSYPYPAGPDVGELAVSEREDTDKLVGPEIAGPFFDSHMQTSINARIKSFLDLFLMNVFPGGFTALCSHVAFRVTSGYDLFAAFVLD